MERKELSRRSFLRVAGLGAAGAALSACAVPTPQIIERTVEVEKEVVVTTEVEVEKEVQVEVEKEVIVTATPEAMAPPSDLSANLVVWVWHNNEDQINLTKPLFNEQFPNIAVEPEVLGFGDLHNKLFTSLAAGAGAPDISWVELSQLGKFAYYGPDAGLLDMMPYVEAEGMRPNFLEWAFNNCLDNTREHLCVFPRAVCPAVTYYRRDVFDAAGVSSEPDDVGPALADWDGWLETGMAMADPDQELWFTPNLETSGPLFSTLGGANYFDPDGELRIGADEELERVLEYHRRGRDAGIDAAGIAGGPEFQTALGEGHIATQMVGAWYKMFISNFAPASVGLWGAVNIPGVSGANGGGDNCVIPAQGKQIEAAWEYVKFICTDMDAARQLLAYGALVPNAWKPFFDMPDWNVPDPFTGGQMFLLTVRDILLQMPGLTLNPNDPIAASALSNYVGQYVRGEIADAAEALGQARAEVLNQI
jgi:ABC-type glycerol-3-phosphate transport system substrate-binding protein